MVSLNRMLQSFAKSLDSEPAPLPPIHYPSSIINNSQSDSNRQSGNDNHPNQNKPEHAKQSVSNADGTLEVTPLSPEQQKQRAQHVVDAVADVKNTQTPTPLTDRYLAHRQTYRHPNRPPFAPESLWQLKYGVVPVMTELVNVVDIDTLNSMPIEAVAILDRINNKLKRYREWSSELNDEQIELINERRFVIDKLVEESIPEALNHYEQLLRFSPHRTKNNSVQGNMTAGDLLTDLFLDIDYELDELLDDLHKMVLGRLASTHRYVKSRTQN